MGFWSDLLGRDYDEGHLTGQDLIDYYTQKTSKDSSNGETYYLRGKEYASMGQHHHAREDFRRAQERGYHVPESELNNVKKRK